MYIPKQNIFETKNLSSLIWKYPFIGRDRATGIWNGRIYGLTKDCFHWENKRPGISLTIYWIISVEIGLPSEEFQFITNILFNKTLKFSVWKCSVLKPVRKDRESSNQEGLRKEILKIILITKKLFPPGVV